MPVRPVVVAEGVEGLLGLVVDDLGAVDVQADEERLVQDGAYRVVAMLVRSLRLLEQGQRSLKDRSAVIEPLFGTLQRVFDIAPFGRMASILLRNLSLGQPSSAARG